MGKMFKRREDEDNYNPKPERKNGDYVPWKIFTWSAGIIITVLTCFFLMYLSAHADLKLMAQTTSNKVIDIDKITNAELSTMKETLLNLKDGMVRIEKSLDEHKRITERYGGK